MSLASLFSTSICTKDAAYYLHLKVACWHAFVDIEYYSGDFCSSRASNRRRVLPESSEVQLYHRRNLELRPGMDWRRPSHRKLRGPPRLLVRCIHYGRLLARHLWPPLLQSAGTIERLFLDNQEGSRGLPVHKST